MTNDKSWKSMMIWMKDTCSFFFVTVFEIDSIVFTIILNFRSSWMSSKLSKANFNHYRYYYKAHLQHLTSDSNDSFFQHSFQRNLSFLKNKLVSVIALSLSVDDITESSIFYSWNFISIHSSNGICLFSLCWPCQIMIAYIL